MSNDNVRKDNDSKKIITMIVMICTLMLCTTGATYAFFAISATNATATGTAATVGLNLGVSRVAPTSEKWSTSSQTMVPQLDAGLGTAMNSTNSCVDGNGNVVCQVYKITIENTGTSSVRLRGAVFFNIIGTYNNLFWRQTTDGDTLGSYNAYKYSVAETNHSTTINNINATLVNDLFLTKADKTANSGGDYSEYFVVVWIRETNNAQNTTDSGKWTMSVSFKDSTNPNYGVTSTITS